MRRFRSSAAFTLIELLVVVAIIAILMGILLPSLSRAREQAKTVRCAANLREIGMAEFNYATEFNNLLAWAVVDYGPSAPVPDGGWTYGTNYFWQNLLYPFASNMKIFYCPNTTRPQDLAAPGNLVFGGNYAASILINVLQPGNGMDWRIPQRKLTSILKTDCYMAMDSRPGSSSWYADPLTYDPVWGSWQDPKHGNGSNVVFVDGHVSHVPSSEMFREAFKPGTPLYPYGNGTVSGQWSPNTD